MSRVFSGVQPSGSLHLGNYLGAVRQWVAAQDESDAIYCIVDLHALTLEIEPAMLRQNTLETAFGLLGAGLDPQRCTLFVQSAVAGHSQLAWLLECTATFGELGRMTQFREKGEGRITVRSSLFTYPVLMAADILLYDTDEVPVGDDQRQHLELARDLAMRWNNRYGETFVVPEARVPAVGARVMDLQHPERKMSKSTSSPAGVVLIDDAPNDIVRKIRRAVTDSEPDVTYEPQRRPGVSNLLELLAAASGAKPDQLAELYSTNGALKTDVADAIVELLRPVRERIEVLRQDPGAVEKTLRLGSDKARELSEVVLARAMNAVGLLQA